MREKFPHKSSLVISKNGRGDNSPINWAAILFRSCSKPSSLPAETFVVAERKIEVVPLPGLMALLFSFWWTVDRDFGAGSLDLVSNISS